MKAHTPSRTARRSGSLFHANIACRIVDLARRFNDAALGYCASARVLPVPDSRSPPAPELPSAGSGPVFPACSAAGCRGMAFVPDYASCRGMTFVPRCVGCHAMTLVPGYVGCRGMAFVPGYEVDCFLHRSLSPRCFSVEGFSLPRFLPSRQRS